MFRSRRPLRRWPPVRRSFAPGPRLGIPPQVADAVDLMRRGEFAQAADRFLELARQAEGAGRPAGAAELYLRAARCHEELDQHEKAGQSAEKALRLFIQARRPDRARQVLAPLVAGLERLGQHERAERLRQEAQEALGVAVVMQLRMPGSAGLVRTLPSRCPTCGGPLMADELSWTDPVTAECPFCGGPVKVEDTA